MAIIREKSVRSNDEMKHEISISHQLEILLKRHVKHTPTTKITRENILFVEQRLECPSLLDTLRSSAHLVAFDLFFSFVCSCVEFTSCILSLKFPFRNCTSVARVSSTIEMSWEPPQIMPEETDTQIVKKCSPIKKMSAT